MDWDVEPTAFDEWVTIQNPGSSPQLAFDSDDGFAIPDPLVGPWYYFETDVRGELHGGLFSRTWISVAYPTVTLPDDHGSLFDFSFGAVAPATSVCFKVLYGAAANRADAMTALTKAGAEVSHWARPTVESGGGGLGCDTRAHSGVELRPPNTFMFAFVTTNADLRITKSDSPDHVRVGQDLAYTLTVQNAGPNATPRSRSPTRSQADVTLEVRHALEGILLGDDGDRV